MTTAVLFRKIFKIQVRLSIAAYKVVRDCRITNMQKVDIIQEVDGSEYWKCCSEYESKDLYKRLKEVFEVGRGSATCSGPLRILQVAALFSGFVVPVCDMCGESAVERFPRIGVQCGVSECSLRWIFMLRSLWWIIPQNRKKTITIAPHVSVVEDVNTATFALHFYAATS